MLLNGITPTTIPTIITLGPVKEEEDVSLEAVADVLVVVEGVVDPSTFTVNDLDTP